MEGSLYDHVGGRAFFVGLVERFYAGIANDVLLRPMYPEDLLGPSERLALFLIQYFGGPDDYNQRRGEPRLRMRHLRFTIDKAARDAWMSHMTDAVNASTDDAEVKQELLGYFSNTATFLVNQGLAIGGRS